MERFKAQAVRLPADVAPALNEAEHETYLRDLEYVGEAIGADIEAGREPRDDRFNSRVLQLLKGEKREHFCGAGESMVGITPDGTVLPCILLGEADGALGHVDDPSATWKARGRAWREGRRPRAECLACEAHDLCGGGCPAILPICGADECAIIKKNCEVARALHQRFRDRPEALLVLAGII